MKKNFITLLFVSLLLVTTGFVLTKTNSAAAIAVEHDFTALSSTSLASGSMDVETNVPAWAQRATGPWALQSEQMNKEFTGARVLRATGYGAR